MLVHMAEAVAGFMAAGSAGFMADTTKDGAIAVSDTGTAAARAGAISIRPAASDRRQHRDDARLLRRGRVIHYGSCLPGHPEMSAH